MTGSPIHRRAFLLGATAFLLAPPALAAETPVSVITDICKRLARGRGDGGGQFVWVNAEDRQRYFSKALNALWTTAEKKTPQGDLGPIDFDPITNSQDPLVLSYSVTAEKQDARRAIVVAALSDKKGDAATTEPTTVVRYDLVLEGSRWKIDDIRGGDSGKLWSVRDLLKNYKG